MLSKHYFSKLISIKHVPRSQLSASTSRLQSTTSSEYTSTPNYPPIYSLEPKAVKKQIIESAAEKLKKVPTVEEKLLALNVPRYWGWDSVMVNEGNLPYDFLPFAQHITRTRMIEVDSLPVPLPSETLLQVMKTIKDQLEKIIVFELCHRNHKFLLVEDPLDLTEMRLNELYGKALIEQINRCILSNFAPHVPHLVDLLVDFQPRHEAFWCVGGFYPSEEDKWYQRYINNFWERSNDNLDDPMDRWIQYIGSPVLAVRSRFPLDPIAPFPGPTIEDTAVKPVEEVSNSEKDGEKSIQKPTEIAAGDKTPTERTFEIPSYKYDPRITHGLEIKRQYGLNIPGFFANDRHEFGFLSYHKRNHMLGRPPSFGVEHDEALHAQAILASYSWLLGQACYQGFSTYNDPTYPLTAQTVLTDGRLWSFYAYQLNTTTLYHDHIDTNPHQNVCYGLKTTELYHSIEDGKVKGWNEKALETLFSFYLNECRVREGVQMKPYLDPQTPLVECIEDDEKRNWLHKHNKLFMRRPPKHGWVPQIYEWEKIYRIDNDTMPMSARHKFYQKGEDPMKNDTWINRYERKYIPKSLREKGKFRQKYEKTFWPDALV